MLCDICGKNQATVHLTEIIDDQMNELHLCEECARHKSAAMEQQFGLSDLLAGMAGFEKSSAKDEEALTMKCPACGLTYADFKKVGRLGCGECYNVFRKYLAPLLKRIHGSNQHIGKSPQKAGRVYKKKDGLAELKSQLAKAIQDEAFEEAARLRDRIKEMETKKEKE
ncbi:MAG: UvrB/UvrC motif-containing protein [Candidatus Omnitrophica bacterium]|jgi:protein arginine kinase activator|nr:UvrB/UvrC motif-containing protein [Candidatus Omnitrophota bacterium]MDD3274274.1 UvrB/UvrC motif-containing protein [Candidatus Omnitrophota bacterium]MDD5077949.1 UvrB/UvrC motif-containing protein [Candidatus Omnitrophota bacterium]MDD5725136.1 UvrB/UvrC motif-containing protein [Candidatus Omnitrophota bacterium]